MAGANYFGIKTERLMQLGINSRGRDRLRTFTRLTSLVGLSQEKCLSTQLEEVLVTGGDVTSITEAREKIAVLHKCGTVLWEELKHLIDHPNEARPEAFDKETAVGLREEALKLVLELEARAGGPNESKSEKAERMRCKLEQRLVPKLRQDIPQWAERLRFMHSEVMCWQMPEPMLEEDDDIEDMVPPPEPPAEESAEEWEAPAYANPAPTRAELRLLRQMDPNYGREDPWDTPATPPGSVATAQTDAHDEPQSAEQQPEPRLSAASAGSDSESRSISTASVGPGSVAASESGAGRSRRRKKKKSGVSTSETETSSGQAIALHAGGG